MESNKSMRLGQGQMLAAMALSGTLGWFVLQSGQPAFNVVFFRCLIGAACLALFIAWRGLWRPWPFTRRSLLLCLAGGVALVGNWLLLFNAYRYSSIGLATVVYQAQPFILYGMAVLWLGEVASRRKLAALGIAFIGLLLIIWPALGQGTAGGQWWLGVSLALGAAFFYALATLITKRLPAGIPPHLIACAQTLTGALLLWPLLQPARLAEADAAAWGCLAVLGMVHTCVMYILMYSAFRRLPTTMIGALGFVYPLAAVWVDYLAYGHALLPGQWLGMALIVLANAWLNGWLGARRGRLAANKGPLSPSPSPAGGEGNGR
ncbi:DMT family transporter [Chromobacterium sp. IIBBL 290-4]|uniref:DMT family transporter n=1 Tax=Chromobacterium sp. IIBBL 290-4 TaxID=2953890 RepID=UPI0020B65E8C|nr:DMT family transporter [Chromobacterium sp. IIBBL 290-4]UTH75929.1 DMT family transporter [Chromobacterium sp. IIBBL 290-4]